MTTRTRRRFGAEYAAGCTGRRPVSRRTRVLGRALAKGFSWASERPWLLTVGQSTVAGPRVAPSTAMRAAAVYAATSLIADSLSSLPLRTVRRDDETRRTVRPPEAAVIWDRPNPLQPTPAFISTVVLSLLLWGNAYVQPRRRRDGTVFELWPLDPDRVTEVEAVESGESVAIRYRIDGQDWLVNEPGRPVQLIHIPLIVEPGRIKGISPIEQQAELLGISLAAQEYAARMMGDGVAMSGVIEVPERQDDVQAEALWSRFRAMYAGPRNAGRVVVLSGGAQFKPLSIPPAQLQFLEQMQFTDRRIASIYRVPPHMIGDVERSTSWGTGIEEQTIQFVQHTLVPLARRIEVAIESTILASTPYEVRFAFQGLLRGNAGSRASYYAQLWQLGALSANDIRRLEDMPPIDGGDTVYTPLNYAPAGTATASEEAARLALIESIIRGGHSGNGATPDSAKAGVQ